MRVNFLIVSVFVFISACGFAPVHKQSGVVQARLAQVAVPLLKDGRTEHLFSIALEELMNPARSDAYKPMMLELSVKRQETPAIIQQDRRITRYRISLTANYRLFEKEGGKLLTEGDATIRTSYDDLTSEFANYSAQVDSEERAAKELAQLVYQRLLNHLSQP